MPASRLRWLSSRRGAASFGLAGAFLVGAFLAAGFLAAVLVLPPALTLRVPLLPFFGVAIAQMFLWGL